MLNELESIRKGLASGGIEFGKEHPRVKRVGRNRKPILVRLDPAGGIEDIQLVPDAIASSLWTFQDGQHNSFPFVSLPPLIDLSGPERKAFNQGWKDARTPAARRQSLREAAHTFPSGTDRWLDDWPRRGLLDSLRTKRTAVADIEAEATAVPAVIDRFLSIFSSDVDVPNRRRNLIGALRAAILREVESGIDDWLELARAALIGEEKQGKSKKLLGASFYFDVASQKFNRDVHDPRNFAAVARALSEAEATRSGRCAITGDEVELIQDNFPQPTLPALGRTYLFSKNADLLAAGSYHRFGPDAFPVGRLLAEDLAGAITELIIESRRNITWCTVPGEKRKTTDLLVAFVEGVPDAPAIGLFVGDADGDPNYENDELDPVGIYERRTERLIDALKGKAQEDFRRTPLQICLLRKADEGNRKILLHRHLLVGQLYECAQEWTQAQRNLPPRLFLWHKKKQRRPQSLMPLSIPSLTKRQFLRGGTEATDTVRLPATEVFQFFLQEGNYQRQAQRFLRIVLQRHHQLLEAAAHVKHGARNSKPDTGVALRVLTSLAILLHVLGRRGGSWMNEAAFRLGQLLSIADHVHAGYCADVRRGQVPPTLLGNAVFSMAQANPAKALAALARRWKPYGSWAKRASAEEAAKLRSSKKQEERDQGWKISQAIWQHRRAAEISTALHDQLPLMADDVFRAELLLGYIAGLPPRTRDENRSDDQNGEESNGDV